MQTFAGEYSWAGGSWERVRMTGPERRTTFYPHATLMVFQPGIRLLLGAGTGVA